jgi:hypothetical protein
VTTVAGRTAKPTMHVAPVMSMSSAMYDHALEASRDFPASISLGIVPETMVSEPLRTFALPSAPMPVSVTVVPPRWAADGTTMWASARPLGLAVTSAAGFVPRSMAETHGELRFSAPKTRRSRATVSFPPFLDDELAAHIAAFPDPDETRRLVFTSDNGTPLWRSNFRRRVWVPAAKTAKLPEGATFHSLRHATASWLIDSGANAVEVAQKLRHTRVTTTLQLYSHLFPGTDDRVDALLEARNHTVVAPTADGMLMVGGPGAKQRGR